MSALADALHQSGDLDHSVRLFQESEEMQAERQAEYPILKTLPGYWYCARLLDQGRNAYVVSRASRTLLWHETESSLLDIALDHLSLGLPVEISRSRLSPK
jgi:hypothetical protein